MKFIEVSGYREWKVHRIRVAECGLARERPSSLLQSAVWGDRLECMLSKAG